MTKRALAVKAGCVGATVFALVLWFQAAAHGQRYRTTMPSKINPLPPPGFSNQNGLQGNQGNQGFGGNNGGNNNGFNGNNNGFNGNFNGNNNGFNGNFNGNNNGFNGNFNGGF